MKVYFAGSIRGGRQDAELYRKVIAALKEKHQVLTEHVGDLSLSTVEDKGDQAIYEQDTAWLRECNVVVAECTQVSLGVGYELAYAEAHGKKKYIFSTAQRKRSYLLCWPEMNDSTYIAIRMNLRYWRR
ncbi:nucleoside 2-deoxyribosyltransferase [Selenomonas ruminantium]|uniref:nucleoside 2-deoxyribosyltransferase n=1 Tax=Selenomonas ruminantium TaxID=971 RepID=UPI0026EDCD3E|nr:nucleoside 2-deoxyribosyltransferase [Selenomonas ruminantium]